LHFVVHDSGAVLRRTGAIDAHLICSLWARLTLSSIRPETSPVIDRTELGKNIGRFDSRIESDEGSALLRLRRINSKEKTQCLIEIGVPLLTDSRLNYIFALAFSEKAAKFPCRRQKCKLESMFAL
jgi:hypothetical protein